MGRPIGDVRHNLVLEARSRGGLAPDLESLIADVIDTVQEREREVRDREGRWYSLRVRPYLTLDNKVDGAVLVLVDIDDLKRSAAARSPPRAISPKPSFAPRATRLLVLDADLRVDAANDAFYRSSTFRRPKRKAARSMISGTGNGTFPACASCWRTFCPGTAPSTTSR